MKSVFRWLASLFQVKVVWIEKGQGRWVRQRQYHPLLYVAALAVILAVGVTAGKKYFQSDEAEPPVEFETSQESIVHTLPEPKIREFKMNEFFPASIDANLSATLIPEEVEVTDDELWIRINKKQYKLYLYRGNNVSRQYDIAVGRNKGNKQRRGDNRTPTGLFVVQSIENASAWSHDFRDGKGVIKGAYGPWFIRLKTGWQGIGIHGTHDPDSLGSMVSEGCIRMKNNEIEELKKVAFKNMKVLIEE